MVVQKQQTRRWRQNNKNIHHNNMSRVMRKPTFWFPKWSDTNQAVQLQKMARGLKFRILKLEGLYYLCSENKGADQLRGYREADLRLCFRICKMPVFSRRSTYNLVRLKDGKVFPQMSYNSTTQLMTNSENVIT